MFVRIRLLYLANFGEAATLHVNLPPPTTPVIELTFIILSNYLWGF